MYRIGPKNKHSQDIPHASAQLNKATISESETNDDVGRSNTSDLDVDQGKYKGRQRESTQAKGSRVGELAVGSRPV